MLDALADFETQLRVDLFTEPELAALELADRLSLRQPEAVVDTCLRERLRKSYSAKETLELAMVCAVLVGMAKMLFAFDWADREQEPTPPKPAPDSSPK